MLSQADLRESLNLDEDRSDPEENHLHIAAQKSRTQKEFLTPLAYKPDVKTNISISLPSLHSFSNILGCIAVTCAEPSCVTEWLCRDDFLAWSEELSCVSWE